MKINDIVLEPSITKKGVYGVEHCQNGMIFYKDNIKYLSDDQEFFKKVKFIYSPLVLANKKEHMSYYEFDVDLYQNTLYDALYFRGKYWNLRKKWFDILKTSMFDNYRIMSMNETSSKKFFIDRINEIDKSKQYCRNAFVLDEVQEFIKNIDDYAFRAHISNGDLTDTNICLNNKICDTECFGYNVVIADLAIFFVSIIYGRWIYPKYNYPAYQFRKNKVVNPKFEINYGQKDILKRIVFLVKAVEFDYFKKLVIMRLVTPISLDKLEENDRLIVDGLIRIIHMSNINNIIKNINEYSKS